MHFHIIMVLLVSEFSQHFQYCAEVFVVNFKQKTHTIFYYDPTTSTIVSTALKANLLPKVVYRIRSKALMGLIQARYYIEENPRKYAVSKVTTAHYS